MTPEDDDRAVWTHQDRLAARQEEGDPARDWAGDETNTSDER